MKDDSLVARIGTFFIVVGVGVLIIFITSDLAQTPDFDFLFIAVLLVVVGWLFQRRRPARPSSGRFSIFRRGRGDREQENQNENPEKN